MMKPEKLPSMMTKYTLLYLPGSRRLTSQGWVFRTREQAEEAKNAAVWSEEYEVVEIIGEDINEGI